MEKGLVWDQPLQTVRMGPGQDQDPRALVLHQPHTTIADPLGHNQRETTTGKSS